MHPALTEELVREQLAEARAHGLFGPATTLEDSDYPVFYVRFRATAGHERLLRFEYEQFDTVPLDVGPVDPVTRDQLSPELWMRRDGEAFPTHSVTGRPFLCIPFARAYFTHNGHDPLTTNEPWAKFRADFGIAPMIRAIAERFASGRWS